MALSELYAREKAADLVATLGSDDWEPNVWENCGWHYTATSKCGRLAVHSGGGSTWIAFLNAAERVGGRWIGRASCCPKHAVDNAIEAARGELREIEDILEGLG